MLYVSSLAMVARSSSLGRAVLLNKSSSLLLLGGLRGLGERSKLSKNNGGLVSRLDSGLDGASSGCASGSPDGR